MVVEGGETGIAAAAGAGAGVDMNFLIFCYRLSCFQAYVSHCVCKSTFESDRLRKRRDEDAESEQGVLIATAAPKEKKT